MKHWNIGQQAKLSMTRVRQHCNLSPYVALVSQQKDINGFVTLQDVNEATQQADISNSRFLGSVWVPIDSLIF